MKTNLICLFVFLGCFFGQTLAEDNLQPPCENVPDDCPNGGVHVNTTADCSVCMPGEEDAVCAYAEDDGEDTCDEGSYLSCDFSNGSTGLCVMDGDSNPRSNGDSKSGSDGKVNVDIDVNIEH